jgi:hypothetical protein
MTKKNDDQGSAIEGKAIPQRIGRQGFKHFTKVMRAMKDRDVAQAAEAIRILRLNQFPTPDHVRRTIYMTVGRERARVLSNHAYWKEKKLRDGLDALMNTADTAYVDVCRHDAALTAFSSPKGDFQDHIEHTVGNPAQKDVMAFCAAAAAIVDTTRRIRESRSDIKSEIEVTIDECFGNEAAEFIKDLRNNLSHGSVVIPGWVITSDGQGISGAMAFQVDDLLSFGEWKSEAKRYIAQATDGKINIVEPIRAYFKMLTAFHTRLLDLFALNVTDAEQDYFEIEDTSRRWGNRQAVKVLVSQIGQGKNPYKYLHRYFKPEEIREIRRRPDHSVEQVQSIISLRSVEADCDDELRIMIYKLFGVPADS